MATDDASSQEVRTGHIGLNVSDLERSKQFYQEVFGFRVMGESTAEDRRFLFLGNGTELILTLWQQSHGRFQARQPGLHHLSFQVATIEAVKVAEERLRALNVRFLYEGVVPHAEGADSGGIFFEDPDGIRLEIYTPTGVANQVAPVPGAPACGFF